VKRLVIHRRFEGGGSSWREMTACDYVKTGDWSTTSWSSRHTTNP
jgi:hypothetical protein